MYVCIYVLNACNCKTRNDCPMNGLCNFDNVVYQGIICPKEDINDRKTYIGISSTKWKIRYGNHKYSFSYEHLKHQTALSKHFWGLKNKDSMVHIKKIKYFKVFP